MNLPDDLFPNAKLPTDANGNSKLTVRFGVSAARVMGQLVPDAFNDPRFSVSADLPLYTVKIENEGKTVATLTMRNY